MNGLNIIPEAKLLCSNNLKLKGSYQIIKIAYRNRGCSIDNNLLLCFDQFAIISADLI